MWRAYQFKCECSKFPLIPFHPYIFKIAQRLHIFLMTHMIRNRRVIAESYHPEPFDAL
jgi:hypothetical protein